MEYEDYLPLTVRQIFYRLVGAYGFEKTERAYERLGNHLVRARRAQIIRFDAIRDDGVSVLDRRHFASSPAAATPHTLRPAAPPFSRLDPMEVGSVRPGGRSVGTSRRDVRGLGGRVGLSPTPQLWEVPTMQQSMSLVGLDVHASQTHAAILDMATGELRGVKLRMAPVEVVEFLGGLAGPVRAVYEAGPTGFGLAARGVARGIDVRVVAAGKVPRAAGDRVKTDKRDAERLARLLAAGELRFAFVPTVADEQFRDVIRAIEDCRGDLMRARHRLSKLLLRRDLRWTGPGSTWTQTHMRWLRSLRFDDVCSQAVFVDYLAGVEMLRRAPRGADRRARAGHPRQPPRHHDRARCAAFAGIDTLSAAGLCAEVGDWHRFRPKQLSGFLGIVPSEHTSDTQAPPRLDHQGRARSTPAGCWSRPPTTTATDPRSATPSPAASRPRTPG